MLPRPLRPSVWRLVSKFKHHITYDATVAQCYQFKTIVFSAFHQSKSWGHIVASILKIRRYNVQFCMWMAHTTVFGISNLHSKHIFVQFWAFDTFTSLVSILTTQLKLTIIEFWTWILFWLLGNCGSNLDIVGQRLLEGNLLGCSLKSPSRRLLVWQQKTPEKMNL